MQRLSPNSRGSATVELALVAPLLIFLLFAIIDLGLLFRDTLILGSACREALRVACVGEPTAAIHARAITVAQPLKTSSLQYQMAYRESSTGPWTPLTDSPDATNSAPSGALLRLSISYPHTLIFGPIASLIGDNKTQTRTLYTTLIARRE